ncbi:MAG: glycosyltransferase family 25 protein [Sphingobacteriales bacterium]|nr:MAG: glycosyltransferase family 25 protein [Sphingobacteriales bacterium]
MKVFVINLKRSEDRRKRVVKHLQDRGVPFELFEAVEGSKLTDEEMEKYCDMERVRKHPKWLTRGTIGACLSHYHIYKKVVDEGLEGACILEDDIVVDKNFASVLENLKPVMKQNKFTLLYYTSWEQMDLKDTGTHLGWGFELYRMQNLNGLNSAAGYVISHDLCKKMMEFVLPIRHGADSWTDFSKGGALPEVYCVYPQPAHLALAKSTIDYMETGSLQSKVSDAINEYKIFPFYQLLQMRRKMLIGKMSRIRIHK